MASHFDSPSSRLRRAEGLLKARHVQGEIALNEPLNYARGESKGKLHSTNLNSRHDDGIVVVWFVYIVRCADQSLYVGQTSDVALRVAKHNDGSGSSYTACRRPVLLQYSEEFATRHEALGRERQIKRWTRRKKEALIAGDLVLLKRL